MSATVPLWDEFQPAMLRLSLQLATAAGGQSFADQRAVSFGMRDFKRDGQRLAINGRPVFLRGRTDSANYPLTGFPPMDKDGWLRVLGILKEWGLNHVRFHSWCPPEAAFLAADELGMYFQVELPNKRSAFKAPESVDAPKRNMDYLDVPSADPTASLHDYALREAELIFRHFGNHRRFRFRAVEKSDAHFDRIADDVQRGENQPGVIDDDAGAERAFVLAARR